MKVELELEIDEQDILVVMKKTMDLAKTAVDLGFSIDELELENEEYVDEDEMEEDEIRED
ncbi:MAG: hypothetical protein DA330_09780 [Nitrososphaera sp.]|mgnify:CR=1 FL=1|jgi:hypothetical protein|nr:hypothetical protein [Nitrososphaera sp.]